MSHGKQINLAKLSQKNLNNLSLKQKFELGNYNNKCINYKYKLQMEKWRKMEKNPEQENIVHKINFNLPKITVSISETRAPF